MGRVVAVADGHGSSSHVRSDAGSRLAVDIACSIGGRLIDGGLLTRPNQEILERLQGEVAVDLVNTWRGAVHDDVLASPWSADELATYPVLAGDPHHGYGTTLMVALAGEQKVVLLQLGDGDVVVARVSGQVEMPVPGDDRLIGNQTTSMCLPAASDDFRFAVSDAGSDPIRFVSITTDGYANAFVADDWAKDVGTDLLGVLDESGVDYVEGEMLGWLSESASVGGDDVTMGLLVAEVEVVHDLEKTVTMENPPGSTGPQRNLSEVDVAAATTERRAHKRRMFRPLVLVPLGLLLAASAGVVAFLTL